MGDAADDAMDAIFAEMDMRYMEVNPMVPLRQLREMPIAERWHTQYRGWVEIADMNLGHAQNALAMIRRKRGKERADASPTGRALIARIEKGPNP